MSVGLLCLPLGSKLVRFLAKEIIVFCDYMPDPQNVPKLDFQRQLFYGKNHLILSRFSFNNLDTQIVLLTIFDT